MADLPVHVWIIVAVGVLGVPAATLVALVRSARAIGLPTGATARVAVTVALVGAGWLVGTGALAAAGAYRQDSVSVNPWLGITLVAFVAIALFATRVPVIRRILAEPGTAARLVLPQTFRIAAGVAFLIVLGLGELPAVFAIPAGVGDIAAGAAAPFVAWRLSRGAGRIAAIWFNVLGMVDFVVAVAIGYLAGTGMLDLFDVSPSTEVVSTPPLIGIPAAAVPLAIALHLVSLRRLVGARAGAVAGAGAGG